MIEEKTKGMSWHSRYQKCKSCSTTEIKHKQRGFCYKCYPIRVKLEQLSNWNYSDSSTFVGIKSATILAIKNCDINRVQETNIYIQNQYIERLNKIITFSNLHLIDDEIAAICLKEYFSKAAKMNGIRENIFYASDSLFCENLTTDQIKFIVKQFLLIEICKPLRVQEILIGSNKNPLSNILLPQKN